MMSLSFEPLLHLEPSARLAHGTIIRLKGVWPHEEYVDLMVAETFQENGGMSLMVTTGHKGGLILVNLPVEACEHWISSDWLKENWLSWVYPDCPLETVWVSKGYSPPTTPV